MRFNWIFPVPFLLPFRPVYLQATRAYDDNVRYRLFSPTRDGRASFLAPFGFAAVQDS
jgi:hypothetical protein